MRRAPVIELSAEERAALTRWSRRKTTPARLVVRAQIVLLAAAGRKSQEIAAQLKVPEKTISKWRNRFAAARLAGIEHSASATPVRRCRRVDGTPTITGRRLPILLDTAGSTHSHAPALHHVG